MSGRSERENIGGLVTIRPSLVTTNVVAGGGYNGVYLDSASINIVYDRHSVGNALSCAAVSTAKLGLTADKTCKLIAKIQDCDTEDGEFADYAVGTEVTYDDSYDATQVLQSDAINLSGAKRYIKMLIKATLSNTATDTALTTGVLVFEPGDRW